MKIGSKVLTGLFSRGVVFQHHQVVLGFRFAFLVLLPVTGFSLAIAGASIEMFIFSAVSILVGQALFILQQDYVLFHDWNKCPCSRCDGFRDLRQECQVIKSGTLEHSQFGCLPSRCATGDHDWKECGTHLHNNFVGNGGTGRYADRNWDYKTTVIRRCLRCGVESG